MRPCEDLPPGLPRELVLTGALAKGLPAWYRSCSHSDETSFRMASSSSVDAEEVLQDRGPPEEGLKILGFSDILEVSVSEIGVVGRPLYRYQKGEPRSSAVSALSHNSNCPPEARTHPLEAGTNGEAMRKKQT